MFDQILLNFPSKNVSSLRVFIALELAGAIGMTIILLTALLSNLVKRCSTWYTFCASWIISCLSYCLLFFAGETAHLSKNKSICIVQGALVYSVPTLTAFTTLILLVHSWYNVHFGLSKPPLESHKGAMLVILTGPFVLWMLMLAGFLSFGITHRSLLHNLNGMYCTFSTVIPVKISSLIVIIITFSTIPIQASLALSLSRNFDRSDTRSTISVQTLKTVIRVLIFSFLILIGFVEGLIRLLTRYHVPAVDIILAALPVSGVLIFGVQKDLYQAWKRWLCFKNKRKGAATASSESKVDECQLDWTYEMSDVSGSSV